MEKTIPVSLIDIPKFDLRYYRSPEFQKYLCDDVKKEGILVKPIVTLLPNGHYQVIDGVNRVRCVKKLGWKTIKCDVIDTKDDINIPILGLKVNLFRKAHDVMGIVNVFSYLKDQGMKQKEIAKRFGMSKGYVSQLLALSKLPSKEKLALAKGQITIPQAYLMVRSKRDPDLMEKLGIEYKCDICHSKVSFRERELVSLCSECRSKLETVLRQERDKQSHAREQKEL